MPSRKPRIALTVEPELDAVLQRLSELTGEPKTRIINDFLGQLMPVFEEMANSLQHIKETKDAIPQLARFSKPSMRWRTDEYIMHLTRHFSKPSMRWRTGIHSAKD